MTDGDDATVKDLVRRHWDDRAATFDDDPEHGIHDERQHDRWLSVLREWAGEGPGRALDVGCGTGVLSVLLAELGHDVTGVDAAPSMLAEARAKVERTDRSVEFALGDAEALGLADDAVDLAVTRHLLWTLPEPEAAVDEWRRVVRPGGRVVLFEGHWDHDEPWDEYVEVHEDLPCFHGRTAGELATLLRERGLRDVEHAPLDDPVLRGGDRRYEYHVVAGEVPPRTGGDG